jgi:hypothetical protein
MIDNIDIINLPYPMFPVTEEEKTVLRKALHHYENDTDLAKHRDWQGLCLVVGTVCDCDILSYALRHKICDSLRGNYLHRDLFPAPDFGLLLSKETKNMLRRVWITKLLNQDVTL